MALEHLCGFGGGPYKAPNTWPQIAAVVSDVDLFPAAQARHVATAEEEFTKSSTKVNCEGRRFIALRKEDSKEFNRKNARGWGIPRLFPELCGRVARSGATAAF